MSDLINRQEAVGLLEDEMNAYHDAQDNVGIARNDRECFGYAERLLKDLIHRIRRIPSAPFEITECKDCIHCADDWNGNQPQFTCELGRCGESVHPGDFCSRAERRQDG